MNLKVCRIADSRRYQLMGEWQSLISVVTKKPDTNVILDMILVELPPASATEENGLDSNRCVNDRY